MAGRKSTIVTEAQLLEEVFGKEGAKAISSNALLTLRQSGKLPFHRIGQAIMYDLSEAREAILQATRNAPHHHSLRGKRVVPAEGQLTLPTH